MAKKNKLFIPSLNFEGITKSEMESHLERPDFENGLFNIIYSSIKHYSQYKGSKTAEIFELKNSGKMLVIPKSAWKSSLQSALEYFEVKQEFEKCSGCKKLIDKI
jgi:hypothetical protein